MGSDRKVTATFTLLPPNTRITGDKVSSKAGSATFRFKAIGRATGFQCELVKQPKPNHTAPRASFSSCSSPKSYHHLKTGRYRFLVQAFNPAGRDLTPAEESFTI